MFPLVDNTPTKQNGKELEELITEASAENKETSQENQGDESKEDNSNDEYNSSDESKQEQETAHQSSPSLSRVDCQNIIKYFNTKADLHISSESEEDSKAVANDLAEKFKRKARESPGSNEEFELVSRKGRKKSKKQRSKSK